MTIKKIIMTPAVCHSAKKSLTGIIEVDGDKSISHRSVLLNAIATGSAKISGILEGEDVMDTIKCLQNCGVKITKSKDGIYTVNGVGLNGLKKPSQDLYFGNSGTSARLFMGVLAMQNFAVKLTGDASLSRRDMKRVVDPLTIMGCEFQENAIPKPSTTKTTKQDKVTLPLTIKSSGKLKAIEYKLPIASAQVKSAILLAGLGASGETIVVEREKSRNHTENILLSMGANIAINDDKISIKKTTSLKACDFNIAGDPSSAAFLIAAAILVKGSEITIKNVYINPTRIGFYDTLKQMGANITIKRTKIANGEPIGDIFAKYSPNLKGIEIDSKIVPSMIDEFPIFSIIACFADGRTKMSGLKELAAKESNRILAIANGLSSCGVSVNYNETDYSLVVYGDGINRVLQTPSKPIATQMDHRIAMSFAIAGLKSDKGIAIDDTNMIKTSFPNFETLLKKIGGEISYI